MDKPDMQRTFDTVARHLLAQGEKAAAKVDNKSLVACMYRTARGLKCAVGCLIPDSLYNPDMEGVKVTMLLHNWPILRNVPLINGFEPLLVVLQTVHDENSPEHWKDLLRSVACQFSLSAEVLDA